MLTCKICTKDFINKPDLNNHVKSAHVVLVEENGILRKKFSCPKCNSTYTRKNNLQHHLESVHFGKIIKTIVQKCHFCPELYFMSYEELLAHQQESHNIGNKSFGSFKKIASALSNSISQYVTPLSTQDGEAVEDFNVLRMQNGILKQLIQLLQYKVSSLLSIFFAN